MNDSGSSSSSDYMEKARSHTEEIDSSFKKRPKVQLSESRILLKLSGELLSRTKEETFTEEGLKSVVNLIKELVDQGAGVALVVGAGNIIRGKELHKKLHIDRAASDLIGMYATIINAIALKEALEQFGEIQASIMAPPQLIGLRGGSEESAILSYDMRLARSLLQKKRVIICAGGTGNPFFTTDSAAVLRGIELEVDLVVKSTKVNGVYSKDPLAFPDATRYPALTFEEAIHQNLSIMDQTAFLLAKEHRLPIFIYKHNTPSSLKAALEDETIGSFILPKDDKEAPLPLRK